MAELGSTERIDSLLSYIESLTRLELLKPLVWWLARSVLVAP